MYRVSPEDHALGCVWIRPALLDAIVEVLQEFDARCPNPEWLVSTVAPTSTIPLTATSAPIQPGSTLPSITTPDILPVGSVGEVDAEDTAGNNTGLIVGIVVVLLVLIAIALFAFFYSRRLANRNDNTANKWGTTPRTYNNAGFTPSPSSKSGKKSKPRKILGLDLAEQEAAMQLNNPHVDLSGPETTSLTPSSLSMSAMGEEEEEDGHQMLYKVVSTHYQPGQQQDLSIEPRSISRVRVREDFA